MEERRDKQPGSEPGAQPPALAAGTNLSPVQEAWGAYVEHALHCDTCRSRDAGTCETAEQLHRAYKESSNGAFRKLGEAI